jgi:hypothetical protein
MYVFHLIYLVALTEAQIIPRNVLGSLTNDGLGRMWKRSWPIRLEEPKKTTYKPQHESLCLNRDSNQKVPNASENGQPCWITSARARARGRVCVCGGGGRKAVHVWRYLEKYLLNYMASNPVKRLFSSMYPPSLWSFLNVSAIQQMAPSSNQPVKPHLAREGAQPAHRGRYSTASLITICPQWYGSVYNITAPSADRWQSPELYRDRFGEPEILARMKADIAQSAAKQLLTVYF